MDRQTLHVRPRDRHAGCVAPLVQSGLHAQPGGRSGMPNQRDDGFKGTQRPSPPVLGDVAKESVLDLVPLAGPWGKVRHVDAQAQIVGEPLQAALPRPRAIAITPDFRFGRGTLPPQNRRRALISLGADASNPATEGDTLWVRKNPSPFSSPSTGF